MAIRPRSSRFLKYTIGSGFIIIGVLWISFWLCSVKHYEFIIGDGLRVKIKSKELVTVLEKPFRFSIETEDSTGKETHFEIVTVQGCAVEFLASPSEPDALLIKGLEGNEGYSWLLNLLSGETTDVTNMPDTTGKNFKAIRELKSNGEFVVR